MKNQSHHLFFISFLVIVSSVFSSCKKDEVDPPEPLTVEEINDYIRRVLNETGDFNWANASDHLVWSAIVRGEGTAVIGYSQYISIDDELDQETVQVILSDKSIVIEKVCEIERTANPNLLLEEILLFDSDDFTHLTFKITLFETVMQVRLLSQVRFFEPNYDKFEY
jgi:hypothetical protein